jgi:multicomponent Na+:H+ antiporter subunit G
VSTAWDVLSWIFLMAGAFFAIVGAVGVLRLPDLYTRLHASGVTDTLGAGLILVGLMFQAGLTQVTIKLILVLAFLWFTSPVSTHALARAALQSGLRPVLHRQQGFNEEAAPEEGEES